MEQLIELVLDNFLVVIAIIGFLLSLFSRSDKGKKGTNRMPDFGGGGKELMPVPEAPSRPRPKARPETAARTDESRDGGGESRKLPERVYTSASGFGEEIGASREQRPAAVSAVTHAAATGPAEPHEARNPHRPSPDADDLKRAIVWAEILGPPRAKRPFGRSR